MTDKDRGGSPGGDDRTRMLRGASRIAGLAEPASPDPAARNSASRTSDFKSSASRTLDFKSSASRTSDSGSSASDDADATTALLVKPPAGPAADEPARTAAIPTVASVQDPWKEGDDDVAEGHQHDPHEVTVQLDAVQLDGGVLRRIPGAAGGAQEGSDGPVFVDESGRRSRRLRRIGLAIGLACAGYAVVIAATLMSGNSDATWLPVPGQEKEQPAGKVETSPEPKESEADTPGSGTSLQPGTEPSAVGTEQPAPGSSVLAPRATAPNDQPGSTGDPTPTATRKSSPKPDTGTGDSTPTPPVQPSAETPDESTPADDTPTEPSGDAGGGDGTGPDTVAGAPAPSDVAADGTAARPDLAAAPAPAAPSPEHVL